MEITDAKPASGKTGKKKAKAAKRSQAKKASIISTREMSEIESTMASSASISNEQRLTMIETAAYLRAEKRDFQGNECMDDWLIAEAEIDAMINQDQQNTPLL